jgi:hypothetical protein
MLLLIPVCLFSPSLSVSLSLPPSLSLSLSLSLSHTHTLTHTHTFSVCMVACVRTREVFFEIFFEKSSFNLSYVHANTRQYSNVLLYIVVFTQAVAIGSTCVANVLLMCC